MSVSNLPLALNLVLEQCFNEIFNESEQTRVSGGFDEPIYHPAKGARIACIAYRADFEHSLLHEVAHWCVAGAERRKLEDYGYWYEPDGRSAQAQDKFIRVEARPQAVEWYLTIAAGLPFRVSVDNVESSTDPTPLKDAVYTEFESLRAGAIPPRAKIYAQKLANYFCVNLNERLHAAQREDLDKFWGATA